MPVWKVLYAPSNLFPVFPSANLHNSGFKISKFSKAMPHVEVKTAFKGVFRLVYSSQSVPLTSDPLSWMNSVSYDYFSFSMQFSEFKSSFQTLTSWSYLFSKSMQQICSRDKLAFKNRSILQLNRVLNNILRVNLENVTFL